MTIDHRPQLPAKTQVHVIDLHGLHAECWICEQDTQTGLGVPVHEGIILPDDYQGDWGGVPVCRRCYLLTRGLQAEYPGQPIPKHWVRQLAKAA